MFFKQNRPLPVMNGVPEPNQYRGTRGNTMIDDGIYIYITYVYMYICVYIHIIKYVYDSMHTCVIHIYIYMHRIMLE